MTEERAATRLDERDPVPAEEDGQVTLDEALAEPDDDEAEDDGEDADEGGEA